MLLAHRCRSLIWAVITKADDLSLSRQPASRKSSGSQSSRIYALPSPKYFTRSRHSGWGTCRFRVIAGTRRAEDIQSKCSCLAIRIEEATAREHLEQDEARNQCTHPAPAALTQAFVLVKWETAMSRTFGDTPAGPNTVTVLGSMNCGLRKGR